MSYSFYNLMPSTVMIVQRPGILHLHAFRVTIHSALWSYFQLQLGMKFSPDWVN